MRTVFAVGRLALVGTWVIGTTGMSNTVLGQAQKEEQPKVTEGVREHKTHHPPERLTPHEVDLGLRSPDEFAKRWLQWEHATGDWAGGRPWLDERGLTLEISYSADFFYNLRGGLNTSDADQYRGLLGIGLAIDTEEMGLWRDGTAFVSMFENHGRDITERHVGDLQALNNADAPNRTRLYEFWYEHAFLDGALRIKLGKMDANADFAAPEYGGEFIQSSAGFSPTIPLSTWPDPALGVAVFVEPVDWFFLRIGLYDALSRGTRAGFDTAFHSPDESFTIGELGFRTKLRLFGQDLPGAYRVGGYYHGGNFERFRNDLRGRRPTRFQRGNSGLYVVFDQLLYTRISQMD